MNSVDANAKKICVTLTESDFECRDDGKGFASLVEVKQYFGRFGTPHDEGDATFGRFRLGRGQIMAHASTQWSSSYWRMNVDTPTWGYKYDLSESSDAVKGCVIKGQWYEKLSTIELLSTLQEIRDLIRYSPVTVELNGEVINKNAACEKWDREDDFAYYRAKAEGAVSIYNHGVLVRHDSGHLWGCGGIIVSKKPIDLNISRTDILRKNCPAWKEIAKNFKSIAETYCAGLGERRKTESRREKSAKDLLSGSSELIYELFWKEEVITLLPGKKHVTLRQYCYESGYLNNQATIVENGQDIPKGESISLAGIAVVIHPDTLSRFGCHSATEFKDALIRINKNLLAARPDREIKIPTDILDFAVIRDAFVEKTRIVSPVKTLDKHTRKLWGALSWCLWAFLAHFRNEKDYKSNRRPVRIVLGVSTHADAWTDGQTYIAIDKDVVQRLSTSPLKVASYIFSLAIHEFAHEGDSLDDGHDEVFYQRFHDLTIKTSEQRQHYMHVFALKYAQSMEREKSSVSGRVLQDISLTERVGKGRAKLGLPDAYEGLPSKEDLSAEQSEDMAFLDTVNRTLSRHDSQSIEPDWPAVIQEALNAQLDLDNKKMVAQQAEQLEMKQWEERLLCLGLSQKVAEEYSEWFVMTRMVSFDDSDQEITSIIASLTDDENEREQHAQHQDHNQYENDYSPDDEIAEWSEKLSVLFNKPTSQIEEEEFIWECFNFLDIKTVKDEDILKLRDETETLEYWLANKRIPDELHQYINEGENQWSLQRNASAAGFQSVEKYLEFRKG